MKAILLLLALFASLATNLLAQPENTAPVVWELYRHSDLEVSVNLPKMPNVNSNYDPCNEELKRANYVYAEGAVYEFTVFARVSQGVRPRWCTADKPLFDQSTIDRRLEQIREAKGVVETKTRVAELDAYLFKQDRSVRMIVPDIVHQRWIELAITHHPNETPGTERFFQSLQLNAVAGKEIGEGATVTLGDLVADVPAPDTTQVPESLSSAKDPKAGTTSPERSAKSSVADASGARARVPGAGNGPVDGRNADAATDDKRVATALLIVSKPPARYTDLARKNNEKGTVRLKVTLHTNGAVGTVTPIAALKDGLTEQAIYAARRLVFLPKRMNDKPVDSTITIDYSFSLY